MDPPVSRAMLLGKLYQIVTYEINFIMQMTNSQPCFLPFAIIFNSFQSFSTVFYCFVLLFSTVFIGFQLFSSVFNRFHTTLICFSPFTSVYICFQPIWLNLIQYLGMGDWGSGEWMILMRNLMRHFDKTFWWDSLMRHLMIHFDETFW